MTIIPQMLENQISLMKQCLDFYASEKNHDKNLNDKKSMIDVDNGFLARETLKNVQKLKEQNKELSDQYDVISESQSSPDGIISEIQKMIEQQK